VKRIADAFAAAKQQGRAALVGYLTAYDPDAERSLQRLLTACEAGLDVLELGVPFSDPAADGPGIQAAMVRALSAGATSSRVLQLAAAVRARFELPIVLFSYANPLVRRGDALLRDAAAAGVDGLLVVDLPPEHSGPMRQAAATHGLDWVPLVAPTTPDDRIGRVVADATGFVYAVTLKGVTGSALATDRPELGAQLARIRAHTAAPVAAGFGVRTPDDVRSLAAVADGVVVGTALIEAAQRGIDELRTLVSQLRVATGGAS
jgi:tryptophan synthase alpha chain